MKQIITLLLVSFIFTANAQIEKKWVLGANLGYRYEENGTLPFNINNPMISYNYGTNVSNELNLGFNLGRKFNDNIVLGLGINSFISKNIVYHVSSTTYKGKGLGPIIYMDFIKRITNRLSILVKGYIQYDFCSYKVDLDGSFYGGTSSFNTIKEKYKYQYLNSGMRPSFRFDFNEKFGLELTLGKIEYRKKTNDHNYQTKNDNSSIFQINMEPQEWLVGLYLNF